MLIWLPDECTLPVKRQRKRKAPTPVFVPVPAPTAPPHPAPVSSKGLLFNAMVPAVDGKKVVPRSGFGPRLIYVVGGRCAGGRLSTAEVYDPQAASWKQLAGLAGARSRLGCVALDGKLYAPWAAMTPQL